MSTVSQLDILIEKGNKCFLEQNYLDALPFYKAAVVAAPKNHHVLSNFATTLMQLGQFDEAKSYFEMSLDIYPENISALNNLAILYGRLGDVQRSLDLLLKTNDLSPNDPDVLSNIGVCYNRLSLYERAIPWFENAIFLSPNFSDAHFGKAAALEKIGQLSAAQLHCQKAIDLKPSSPGPRLLQVMLALPTAPKTKAESQKWYDCFFVRLSELARWANESDSRLNALGEIVGDRQPFLMAYRRGCLRSILSEYGDLMSRAAYAYWYKRGAVPIQNPPPRKRIRIAILNEQMRRHSVWDIILRGMVKNINRDLFEVYLYHTGSIVDEQTQWAASCSDKFIQGPKGHAEWIAQIKVDLPDVLFFPEIGMDALTCKLAALRLAPLQVVSWGHPITTGLKEVDLYFSGALIEPSCQVARKHYSEKLILLPGTGACTEPLNNIDMAENTKQVLPAPCRNVVRIVICQRPFKVDPIYDDMIAQLIFRSNPCELYLISDSQIPWATDTVYERLSEAVARYDLRASDCIKELPWLSREQFLGMLDEMDIYLDMPAFSGYTTAWQAIHRGLPIVTLEGEFMRQRLASGLLRKIEQTETIAQSEEEYIEITARLAKECRNPELRAKRRAAIKAAAPKADHDISVVRAFEKTLIDELAARGRTFDFTVQSSEMMKQQTDSVVAPPESSMMSNETNQIVYPWQLLNGDLHLHTLEPNYAPVGLLEMIAISENSEAPFKVLDVGCFCGGSGRWLKQKSPGTEVIGIEMLEKAAAVAAQEYDKVIVSAFETVDFAAEGLLPSSVDAIIAADVLEHLYNPWLALERLKPLLTPGGAIYISLPNVRNLNVLNALAKGEWQYTGAGILDITHIRFFTKKQALEMLDQTGWQATEIRINPDSRLMPAFEGKDLSQIQNIELDDLRLTGLSQEDMLEMLALQLFIRAVPK